MGTSNFYYKNADSVYSVFKTEYDEDGNDINVIDSSFIEDEIEYFRSEFKKKFKKSFYPMGGGNNERNFSGTYIGDISKFKKYCDIDIEITFRIILRSGYYDAACFDYEIYSAPYFEEMSQFDYYESDKIVEHYKDVIEYDTNLNDGMKSIQKENVENWIERTLEETHIDICNTFKKLCEDEFKLSARFSNGETIYSKI